MFKQQWSGVFSNYKQVFYWLQNHKLRFSKIVALLVYGFGIWGLHSPFKAWFLMLTPLSLLLSFALLCWNHPKFTNSSRWFFALAFCIGFFVEVLGVNTGFPFGDYGYGEVLGIKIWNTPLLIGVNWALITYCANELLSRLLSPQTPWPVFALSGAAAPTALDVLIEPVAIRLGYWSWARGTPPIENYVGWFAVAFLIAVAYRFLITNETRNPMAPVLLGLQLVFFVCL